MHVGVHPKATGATPDLLEEVAGAVAKAQPVAPGRKSRFAYLLDHDARIRHTGWNGAIRQLTPVKGGYRVRIAVKPALATERGPVVDTGDYWLEDYLYDPDRKAFTLLEASEDDPPPLKAIFWD